LISFLVIFIQFDFVYNHVDGYVWNSWEINRIQIMVFLFLQKKPCCTIVFHKSQIFLYLWSISKYSALHGFLNNWRMQSARDLRFSPIERRDNERLFLQYYMRQNHSKISHFCKTLQEMHETDLSFRRNFAFDMWSR
jgi:hypothetical protein